tara:strand:+ start:846 stop:1439 length:594 start_codon:yes stop_codon:yes gene_type:complete
MAAKGFWGGQGGAIVDPKRSFRWLVSFGNNVQQQNGQNVVGLQEWYAKSANKPSFEITETPHNFINHTFYYPGRVQWQTIDITLVDPSYPNDASQALVKALQNSGYYLPTDVRSASNTIMKSSAVSALGGQVKLKQLGQDNSDILETWTLINPWIKNVTFGDLAYDTEDMVEITLTVRYDYATIDVKGDKSPTSKPQ